MEGNNATAKATATTEENKTVRTWEKTFLLGAVSIYYFVEELGLKKVTGWNREYKHYLNVRVFNKKYMWVFRTIGYDDLPFEYDKITEE